ncbi:MAG: PAS domain S-box protein, partial [bacterium]|nr:PAS domain S-box protein [bacterium]
MKLDIPVIISTGTGSEEIAINAMKLGATDYLIKDPELNHLKVLPITIENAFKRRKSESDSQKNEQFFRELFEQSNDAIFILNNKDRILDANQSACELLGFEQQQLNQKSVLSLFDNDTITEAEAALESVKSKGYLRFDSKFRKSYGETLDVEIGAKMINAHDGIYQLIVRDITERKRKEIALIENQQTLKRILENVQTGIFIIDPIDHRIVDVNRNALQILDATKDAVVGSICFEYICPNTEGECPVIDQSRTVENIETCLLNAKGEQIPVLKTVTAIMLNGRRHLLESIVDIRKLKEKEAEIKRAYAEYDQIFNTSADAMRVLDLNYRTLRINRAFSNLFGVQIDEANRKKCHDLFKGPICKSPDCTLKKILSGEELIEQEVELETVSGKKLFCILTATALKNPDGKIIGVVEDFKDITDRKKAEHALQISERKYRGIFENVQDVYFRTTSDGIIIDVSPSVRAFTNNEPDKIIGKNVADLYYDPKERRRFVRDLLRNRQVSDYEIQLRVTDSKLIRSSVNAHVIVDSGGNFIGTEGFIRDVTERYKTRLQIEKERNRAQQYLDITGVILLVLDQNGRVKLINKKGCEILGYDEHEILNKNWITNFIPKKIQRKIRTIYKQLMRGKITNNENVENRIITKTGEERIIGWRNTLLRDKNGKIIGVLSSGEDITERKQAEHEIKRHLNFQEISARISYQFVAEKDLNVAINNLLADIGKLSGAGRAYLFQLREGGAIMNNTHEWCASGASPQIENLQNLATASLPWWMEKLRNGETIHIKDVSKLPPEATAEKQILEQQAIKSLIVLPVHVRGELAGFIGFDDVTNPGEWSDSDLAILQISSGVLGHALDRQRAEEALRESEQRYRAVIETTTNGICIADQDEVITFVNQGFANMLGYTVDELLGKNFTELTLTEELIKLKEQTQKRKKGEHSNYETQLIQKDGALRYMLISAAPLTDADGSFKGSMGVFTDITDRKLMEQAIEQERNLLRLLMDSVPDAIYFKDQQSRFTRINKAQAKNLGLKNPDDAIGKHDRDFFGGEHVPAAANDELQIIKTGKPLINKIEEIKRDNGWRKWVSATKVPIRNSNQEVIGLVGISRDVTEMKTIQQELESKNKELDQALVKAEAATRAKSNFLANMSHEIRTP